MASELYGFNEDLNGGNTQNSSAYAYILIDQMRLNHAHWKDLIEVVKPKDHHTMVAEPVNR